MPILPGQNRRETVLVRVLAITREGARELAKRWKTSQVEVFRYLIELAVEGAFDEKVRQDDV